MLDDFREQASTTSFFDEEEHRPVEPEYRTQRQFLGMTPFQRFLIALLLFGITVLLSTFCLVVTGKLTLPFLS